MRAVEVEGDRDTAARTTGVRRTRDVNMVRKQKVFWVGFAAEQKRMSRPIGLYVSRITPIRGQTGKIRCAAVGCRPLISHWSNIAKSSKQRCPLQPFSTTQSNLESYLF